MLRMPHIRKHTPQSSRQTRRGVHKRVHVFHANVTHTTTIQQTRRSVHKRAHVFHANVTHHNHPGKPSAAFTNAPAPANNVTHPKRPRRPIGTTFNPEQSQHTGTSQYLPPATVKHSKKSPRGVQRGRGFAAPLRFSFFLKKILHAIRQKSKRHTVFKKKYF